MTTKNTAITAAERAALVAYASSGSYVLEVDADDRYISNNTKTATFWDMFVADRKGDAPQACDDLYDILVDMLENERGYKDQNRSAALREAVWIFKSQDLYLKVCVEPHRRWMQVVIHYHWQLS